MIGQDSDLLMCYWPLGVLECLHSEERLCLLMCCRGREEKREATERKGRGRDRGKEQKGRGSFSLVCVSVTALVERSPEVGPFGKANNGGHLTSPSLTARREVLGIEVQDD